MNLQHDLQHLTPGRPGPDELVPSRYALRIGEIDVLVVSDGVLTLPGAMLAHNAEPAVRAAWLNDMFLPPDAFDWALNVVVVRSGGQTILIDAGMGGPGVALAAGRAVDPSTGGRRHRSRVRDRRGADPHAHGPRWRAARRRGEGPTASGPADPRGGRRGQVLGVARFLPRLHAAGLPGRASGDGQTVRERVPQPAAARSRTSTKWRRAWSSIAPAATPPGTAWSAWRPAATG